MGQCHSHGQLYIEDQSDSDSDYYYVSSDKKNLEPQRAAQAECKIKKVNAL